MTYAEAVDIAQQTGAIYLAATYKSGERGVYNSTQVAEALATLREAVTERDTLKAEVESWRILSETHEECGEEWAGRALKAEAEVERLTEEVEEQKDRKFLALARAAKEKP